MDIRELLTYLQEYDIKNLDIVALQKNLINRKDILANIGVVFLAFIIASNINGKQKIQIRELSSEIAIQQEKTTNISQLKGIEAEFNSFASSFTEGIVNANQVIDRLDGLALARDVQILSFTPQQMPGTDFYDILSISLEISASRYSDIGFFIYDIENSAYNFRIENWVASSQSQGLSGRRRQNTRKIASAKEAEKEKIIARVIVASIKVKK